MGQRTVVLKFGSSVLRSTADLPSVVHEIYRWYRDGWRVLAVVSALNTTTDRLSNEARTLAGEPEPNALAELLATGERHSAALLGIALDRAGIPARVADPREARFTTEGTALDATPIHLDRAAFEHWFTHAAVVVFPGFFGYDTNARLQLLGRGGSDLSAVYIAEALGAERCCLLKNVDGVYERDPASSHGENVRRYAKLGYEDAIERAQKLFQPKAVRALQQANRTASVAALARDYESIVGPFQCELVDSSARRPLRALLLGLGTVGTSVYERMVAMPDQFELAGILVRDREKHLRRGVPGELLLDRQELLAALDVDVVIDALPGLEPSGALARYFLAHGVHVVSANKALIAELGPQLHRIAEPSGAEVRYGAAVGGAVPMIEAIERAPEIASIDAILNGTSNFVLSRCSEGTSLEAAVRAAQAAGFAELDPNEDLSGRDAVRKLRILCRLAFGSEAEYIQAEPIDALTIARKQALLQPNQVLRQIAHASRNGDTIDARVTIQAVPSDSGFGRTTDEFNRLAISYRDGTISTIHGRGAGGWPTAEAIIGDLRGLRRRERHSDRRRAENTRRKACSIA